MQLVPSGPSPPRFPAMKTPFLEPKLDGSRYQGHSIPLEMLKDWAAFEELVVEVARSLYLQDHPERRKVPNGFAERFSLHLTGINEGSAKPVIQAVTSNTTQSENFHLFEKARDVVLAAIAVASITATPLNATALGKFPVDLVGYFDRFGRSLREGERIELVAPQSTAPVVVYNNEIRKRLVFFKATEYRCNADLRGSMSEVDAEKRTFILKLADGTRVSGSYSEELRKTAAQALVEYGSSPVLSNRPPAEPVALWV
jgi:hypothetical protein